MGHDKVQIREHLWMCLWYLAPSWAVREGTQKSSRISPCHHGFIYCFLGQTPAKPGGRGLVSQAPSTAPPCGLGE